MSREGEDVLSGRDRAVLRAVQNGRCQLGAGCEPILLVDGLLCADTGVGARLVDAGLVAAPSRDCALAPARLTCAGAAALHRALV